MYSSLFLLLVFMYVIHADSSDSALEPLPSSSISSVYGLKRSQRPVLKAKSRLRNTELDLASTLACHVREYTYKAVKTDDFGRSCWQYITVKSCWGRCDSSEIADWRFPYKQSFHPVCIHGKKRKRRVRLQNCDANVDEELRKYIYVDAVTCDCSVCRSSFASCEGSFYGTIAPENQLGDNEVADNSVYMAK